MTDASIGRLITAGVRARLLGTAFAVDDSTVVTAFHCVGDRHTGAVRFPEAAVDFAGTQVRVRYAAGDPVADCAVLRLDEPRPDVLSPLPLATRITARFWRATGFPASLAELGPMSISGTITASDGRLRGVPAVQLYAEQAVGGLALGGFSGAPVFAGSAPGVVGLIRYNPPAPDAPDRGIGGIVFACPVAAITALLDRVGVVPVMDISQVAVPGLAVGASAAGRQATLPPDRAEFTGRADATERLVAALTSADGPAIVAIHGQPGVGKSALAVHVAHRVSAAFPDARLHIDLRGADQRPVSVADALERLLIALGLPADALAATTEERSAQYRRLLAGLRALIVLDNASSAAQVRALLPEASGCAVLVTARRPMAALDNALTVALDALTADESAALLTAVLDDDARATDQDALAAVARLCGYLPLAIRIAAAQLRSRPHWTMAHLAGRLSDERRRLSVLAVDDLAVRTSFDSSYLALAPELATAFAALGALRGPDFPAWTLAALLDIPLYEAEDLLDALVDAQLVAFARRDITGGHRFRCHDLLRVYAAEKAAQRFSNTERAQGRARLFSGYLMLLLDAMAALGPGKDLFLAESVPIVWQPPPEIVAAAREAGTAQWFADDRPGLVAAARQAYEDGLWPYVWGIVDVLNGLFVAQRHGAESRELKDLALAASRTAADPVAEAGVLYSYTGYFMGKGAYAEAVAGLHEVIERYRALGMADRWARTMLSLAVVERDRGRLAVSGPLLEQCIQLFSAGEDELILASTRQNYAVVRRDQGYLAEAAADLDRCLPIFLAHGDNSACGRGLHSRAVLHLYLGRFADADADLATARPLCVQAGDARWTGIVDLFRARLLGRYGRWAELLATLPACERNFDDSDDDLGRAQVWRTFGAARRALGDYPGALREYARAAAVYDTTGEDRMKAKLCYGTALTHLRAGDPATALTGFTTADELFAELDDQPWLLRTRRWLVTLRPDRPGGWPEVRSRAEQLIDRAGPGFFPAWLRPILAEAVAKGA
ncbi:NB-ARC domain-containing protein [Nocardia brasiliensis]|uniref:NB-ARC domain-containing protein n=1 Tax=Nocardia brasiliensis TaxID=37326 RepID=UPI00245778F2|nr:NB-ARC domain-containing protein [Nocardia brasiliensis]